MSERVKDILGVIRERLETTGYPFISGREIDFKTDPIPSISLSFHPKNGVISDDIDRYDNVREISRQTLVLVVHACVRIKNISRTLEELEDLHTIVHAALFDQNDRRLGRLARDPLMLRSRQNYVPDQHSDVGLIEMTLSIPYFEEY